MSITGEEGTYVSAALESGSKKAGEHAADIILNKALGLLQSLQGKIGIALGTAFKGYLENSVRRYNQVRTLATGMDVHSIIGDDSIYINTDLSFGEEHLSNYSAHSLTQIRYNLLIEGTGGIGKSMLMRYLFLNVAEDGKFIPVLLDLRKINNQEGKNLSIINLVYKCMEAFDVRLPREQFESSLREGIYLFLFDGLDEVKEVYLRDTAAAIQAFASKYPENPCIVTTRPIQEQLPLETFSVLEAIPLTKDQAVELAQKIGNGSEKAAEFCSQLDEGLYEKHKSFAENPLLLCMMYLTFMRNNSIPDHLAVFYKKSFDALYSLHDSSKDVFRREFHCKNLDEQRFKELFAYFCFHSYMKEEYEFAEDRLEFYLAKGCKKLGLEKVEIKNYIHDLQSSVCMLVKDGDTYRFSHRSFQAYFAAIYTIPLPDEDQKKLFFILLSRWRSNSNDYFYLLEEMDKCRFEKNALADGIREIYTNLSKTFCPDVELLKTLYSGLLTSGFDYKIDGVIPSKNEYAFNLISWFDVVYSHSYNDRENLLKKHHNQIAKLLFEACGSQRPYLNNTIYFSDLEEVAKAHKVDLSDYYKILALCFGFSKIYEDMHIWLTMLQSGEGTPQAESFIDSL